MRPAFDAIALLPEIVLTATLALVIVFDLFAPERRRGDSVLIAAAGAFLALLETIALAAGDHTARMAGDTYVVDRFALLGKGIVLASTVVVLLLGVPQRWKGEYASLLIASVLGMVMVVSARDLITFFVAFELLAVPGYLLVGWNKRRRLGDEAAMKYYLLGVVATAVMLYGFSLVFGITQSTRFSAIDAALMTHADLALTRIAVFFVLVGLAFKVSAVPFHFWAPDAYEGAPLPVAAFLSVASKAAGLLALVQLTVLAFSAVDEVWAPVLVGSSILTMTLGNVVALRQRNAVRLLAYSSIAQAGYLLIPLAVMDRYGGSVDLAVETVFEFLLLYVVMNLGAFAVVAAVSERRQSSDLSAFRGLFQRSPVIAVAFAACLLSLAGIPPFGGWFAKLVVFRSAIEADSGVGLSLALVAAVNSAIGLVYYASVVRIMWTSDETPNTTAASPALGAGKAVAIALTALLVVVSGVLPSIVTELGGWPSLVK